MSGNTIRKSAVGRVSSSLVAPSQLLLYHQGHRRVHLPFRASSMNVTSGGFQVSDLAIAGIAMWCNFPRSGVRPICFALSNASSCVRKVFFMSVACFNEQAADSTGASSASLAMVNTRRGMFVKVHK